MKIVKELNVNSIQPMAGCVCSSGQTDAKGWISGIFRCNCSCDNGTTNRNKNDQKARG